MLWCNTPHRNTRAHYFEYLSRYDHLKAGVINCTPDDGHIWCPKHVEKIKLCRIWLVLYLSLCLRCTVTLNIKYSFIFMSKGITSRKKKICPSKQWQSRMQPQKCYVCGLNIGNLKQSDVWISRHCTWSLYVSLLIMIRDYKICVLVSKCNAYTFDSEITIVIFVLNSIFPLYEYQYVSNHSLQFWSTFLYLLFIIRLLLITVLITSGYFWWWLR
jgi:hypothetical protein